MRKKSKSVYREFPVCYAKKAEDLPQWLSKGKLVIRRRGWTAMRVEGFEIRPMMEESFGGMRELADRLVIKCCYGPDNLKFEQFEYLLPYQVVPWHPDMLNEQPEKSKCNWFYDKLYPEVTHEKIKEEEEMSKPIYSCSHEGKQVFGERLTTNTDGDYVMQELGTKNVFLVAPNDCERVCPYSISICQLSGNGKGDEKHKQAAKDQFVVGDLIIDTHGNMHMVVAVDTKHVNAGTMIRGWKIPAEAVIIPSGEEVAG